MNELAANQFNGKCVLNIYEASKKRVLKLFAQLSNLKGNGFSFVTSKRFQERRLELNFSTRNVKEREIEIDSDSLCKSECVCVCVYVCMYVSLCVFVSVCEYVSVCVCLYVFACKGERYKA